MSILNNVQSNSRKPAETCFLPASQVVKALKDGKSVLVTGSTGAPGLLREVARLVAAPQTRVLEVHPPYNLDHFMQQVAASTSSAEGALVEGAYTALSTADSKCDRIVLLVEDAHLLPDATLRYIASAVRFEPKLHAVLVGRPKILATFSLNRFAGLDERMVHLPVPNGSPNAPPGPDAAEDEDAVASFYRLGTASPLQATHLALASQNKDAAAGQRPIPPLSRKGGRVGRTALLVSGFLGSAALGAAALSLVNSGALDVAGVRAWLPGSHRGTGDASVAPPAPAPGTADIAAPDGSGARQLGTVPVPAEALPAATLQPMASNAAHPGTAPQPSATAVAANTDGAGQAPQMAGLPASHPEGTGTPAIIEPEMIGVPSSLFRMGSNDDPSERPPHIVSVAPFLLSKTAVTVRSWQQCVDAKACTLQPKGGPDEPVANVSWADAHQFTAWLSGEAKRAYRLPTEAEWEMAARAGAETRYPWGEAMVAGRTSCKDCGEVVNVRIPPQVNAYPANDFGFLGMGGGVEEWVEDCWHRSYQGAPRNGSVAWDAPDCSDRVLRGGSWIGDATSVRVSVRNHYDASVRYPTHGFRVARSK